VSAIIIFSLRKKLNSFVYICIYPMNNIRMRISFFFFFFIIKNDLTCKLKINKTNINQSLRQQSTYDCFLIYINQSINTNTYLLSSLFVIIYISLMLNHLKKVSFLSLLLYISAFKLMTIGP